MPGKKSSRGPVSNVSAASSSKVSATNAKKSSILLSAFAPSEFQLSLFASVIQGFESQQLRVHDIKTGRLRCEHTIGAGAQIHSLDWGYFGTPDAGSRKQNKKRKRQQSNGAVDQYLPEQAVIALATSEADIRFFSPSEDKVVAVLKGGHDQDVKQFKFTQGGYAEGWSIGGDGKLIQWDIISQAPSRTIPLPNNSISTLARPTTQAPQILCASSIPYAIDLTSGTSQEIVNFDAFKNTIHTLVRSRETGETGDEVFIAADSDRYINLYQIQQRRLVKTFVAEYEVERFATSRQGDALAATTRNGVVQLFAAPFTLAVDSAAGATPKKGKRPGPSRPNATVRLVRPGATAAHVPLLANSFDGDDLVFAWAESGVNICFEKVRWRAEGGALAFEGVKDVVRGKASSSLLSVNENGVREVGKTYVDDSQVVVASGDAVTAENAELDGDEDQESDDEESSEDDAAAQQLKIADAEDETSSEVDEDEDEEMADAASAASDAGDEAHDGDAAEPSFGEILAEKHPEPIAIANALIPTDPDAVSGLSKDITIPSGLSLATVLAQSLRTNDQNLLESCFHTTDTNTVRLTIQRLDSSLAASLLQKLADRLARQPGRYGHLLVWVQWVCVAHGGAIAGRRDVLQKVQSLFRVLNQRAKSLDNLLLLKGKLDMLEAQIGLRKQMQAERQGQSGSYGDEDDVIYIEGQDESSSDEEDVLPLGIERKPSVTKGPRKSLQELADEEADSEDDEDMPMTNGIASDDDSEAESETSYAQKEGGLLDDEAEDSHPSDDEVDQSEEGDESDDEEDSEIDDFINDDSISDVSVDDEDDLEIDDTPEKPPSKKNKRR